MRNLLLFALSLSVSAPAFADTTNASQSASAAASYSRSIKLDVRNVSSGGSDGYVDVTVTTGAGKKKVYSYKYTGGDNNTGNVTFKAKSGAKTVAIHVGSDRRYTIDDVKFPSDPHGQLSKDANPPAPTTAVIQDKNDEVQEATYKVTVKDSVDDAAIPCDPMIINK